MKRFVYLILILIIAFFALKGCLKKDRGFDEDVYLADVRPLEVKTYNFEKPKNITVNGVDYLQARGNVGKFGGELITSTIGEGPKTFNPFNANDNTSAQLAGIMYDGLLTTDPYDGSIIPRLAKGCEILPDKKTYIVHLRRGVKWSDGREITADDVVFTYGTIIFGGYGDTATRDSLYIEGRLPTVEKIDKYTVRFVTPKPFAPFLRTLSTPVAPKHVFKKATDRGKNYFRTFLSTNAKPRDFVTSGAFKMSEYVPGQRVIYVRNPNYYMIDKKGRKLPYLDRYIVLIVGDLNNDMLKFEGLETDVVNLQGSMVARYRELEKHGDFDLYNLGPTTSTTFIVFNLNARKNKDGKYYVNPVKQKWFNDSNFRAAADWAIDRENLVLNVLTGVGEPLYTAESISSIFLNKEIAKGHIQDIEYAKELLKKSGFYLKDNKLYDKYGNRVEFELLTNAGHTQREATGVSIKEDFAKLGMKVNFKPVEFNSLVSKLSNTYDWDAVLIALTGNPLEPHSGYNVWSANGALHLFNQRSDEDMAGTDRILPFEKELNDIFNKAPLELDFNKRKVLYDRYQEIVAKENPVIYLYSPVNIVAIRKKFKNIYPTELGGILHNIEEVYID